MRLSEFEAEMDRLTYPTTTDEIQRRYGRRELDLAAGTERVDQILGRYGQETFASPEDVRLSLYGGLPEVAVGRKGYSDRDPPGVGEVDPVSF